MTALLFCLGLAVSVACCVLVPQALARKGFLDIPGERSSHKRPTPKGGGVGVLLVFVLASLISGQPLFSWLPLTALAGISFVNDLRGISPKLRLAAQFASAGLALGGAWWAGEVCWSGMLLLPAFLFIVATTNYYNFMDGINGMAGITGIIAFGALAFFTAGTGASPLLPVMGAVIGALTGFLPFNLPRARLFMGDVGSILLGFLFAFCVCVCARNWTEFLVMASFLFTFYADEVVTMTERLWRGESLLEPHRRHLYQFLANEQKIAHWKVSVGYGAVQALLILLVLWSSGYGSWGVVVVDLVVFGLWAGIHCFLKRNVFRDQAGKA